MSTEVPAIAAPENDEVADTSTKVIYKEEVPKLPRRQRRANKKYQRTVTHVPPVAAKLLKPQMRLKHPSYHKFWAELNDLDLPTFRMCYEQVLNKRSSLGAIERELVRRKAGEYEKLGILSVKGEKVKGEGEMQVKKDESVQNIQEISK